MSIRSVKFGDALIYVEVAEEIAPPAITAGLDSDTVRGGLRGSQVGALDDAADRAESMRAILKTVLAPIANAVRESGPKEWTVELAFGFEGGAGIPFLTSAKANASIKVTAKWAMPADKD